MTLAKLNQMTHLKIVPIFPIIEDGPHLGSERDNVFLVGALCDANEPFLPRGWRAPKFFTSSRKLQFACKICHPLGLNSFT